MEIHKYAFIYFLVSPAKGSIPGLAVGKGNGKRLDRK